MLRPALGCALVLLLLGCAGREERGAQLAAAFDNGLASLGPLPAVAPAAAPPTGTSPALQRVAAPARPAGSPGPGEAAGLLGAGPETLRRWLGEPALRRREGPAEVWLYAGPACALDLILYDAPGGPRVAHAAARANGAAPRTEAQCLRELAPGGRPRDGTLAAAPPGGRGA